MAGFLLPDRPVDSLDAWRALGGGDGLEAARRLGPEGTIDELRASGLRGRGGGGFPTGAKWAGVAAGRPGEEVGEARAHLDLDHDGAGDVADDGGHDRAGRGGRPHGPEPLRPPGQDPGDVGQRLGVVDQRRVRFVGAAVARFVRRRDPPHLGSGGEQAVEVGGQQAGERVLPLDDLEERLLLAE